MLLLLLICAIAMIPALKQDSAAGPAAAAAQRGLTPKESEVLSLLARGFRARLISERLGLSESTVKKHIDCIYKKYGVHSQQELLDRLDDERRSPGQDL